MNRRDFIHNRIRPSELVEIIKTEIECGGSELSDQDDPDTLMGELIWALISNQGPCTAFRLLASEYSDPDDLQKLRPTRTAGYPG